MTQPPAQLSIADKPPRALFVKGQRVTRPMPDTAIFEIVGRMKVHEDKAGDAAVAVHAASLRVLIRGKGGGVDANLKSFKRIASIGEQLLEQLEGLNAPGRFYLRIASLEDR